MSELVMESPLAMPDLYQKIVQTVAAQTWQCGEAIYASGGNAASTEIRFDMQGAFRGLDAEIMGLCDDLRHGGRCRSELARALGVSGRDVAATPIVSEGCKIIVGLKITLPLQNVRAQGWTVAGVHANTQIHGAQHENVVLISGLGR